MQEFEQIAQKYHIKVNSANENYHSKNNKDNDSSVFDVSNSRRLGRSEVELVQDMYNGVRALIKREKEL